MFNDRVFPFFPLCIHIRGGHDVRYRIFFAYGTVRYKVGVYGILVCTRKKILKTIILARWDKDDFFCFFLLYIES